jgi:cyclase
LRTIRLIARLDIKAPNLIKGVHLEGLRVIGDPNEFARRYYDQGVDELVYMDVVASLYGRNSLTDIVEHTTRDIFIPTTVGGGVRSLNDARRVLSSGADKVAVNTAAVNRPALIEEIARRFGSQALVLSIEAKQIHNGKWEAFTDNGRERTGIDVVEYAKRGAARGAGEILLTSVDREGTRKGFDIRLVRAVTDVVAVPVIASGGMGTAKDLIDVVLEGHADAVAMADILHYGRANIGEIRTAAMSAGIAVRESSASAA